jgi:hypothetical protein
VKDLAPLTLGHFAASTDGELAGQICTQWRGLRQDYVDRATDDTVYQMNQWFSSSDWSKIQDDAEILGNDPAYSELETALGVGMVGDMAGPASAATIDKACKDAD